MSYGSMEHERLRGEATTDRERFLLGALAEREETAAVWFSLFWTLVYVGLLYVFRERIARFLVKVGGLDD